MVTMRPYPSSLVFSQGQTSLAERDGVSHATLTETADLRPPVAEVGDLVIDQAGRTAIRAGTKLDLTRTEYDLLSVLVSHKSEAVPKWRLLRLVWGFEGNKANLVEVHISALRRKLEQCGPRIIHTVHGLGYMVRE